MIPASRAPKKRYSVFGIRFLVLAKRDRSDHPRSGIRFAVLANTEKGATRPAEHRRVSAANARRAVFGIRSSRRGSEVIARMPNSYDWTANSRLRVVRWALRRATIEECIWETLDSDRSRVAPISFMVISS